MRKVSEWCGRSRRRWPGRAGALPWWLAALRVGLLQDSSAGPTRRPRAEGSACPTRGVGGFTSAIFTVRNFHGPPLEGLGPGRRERSDRRTRQGCRREDAWHNDAARRGTTSLSTRTAPLVVSVAGGASDARDAMGRRTRTLTWLHEKREVRQANWCQCSRWKSGRKEKVSHHFHPESWASAREGGGQALTGARAGRAIEHRKIYGPGCRGSFPLPKAASDSPIWRGGSESRGVEEPMHVRTHCTGTWEVSTLSR